MFDEQKDKFSFLLKFIAVIFRPYLRFKHDPPNSERNWEFHLLKFLIWIGSWFIVGCAYVAFFYLFVLDIQENNVSLDFLVKLEHFFSLAKIRQMPDLVFFHDKLNPQITIFFYVVLYNAVIAYAEKEYFSASRLHFNLSGLIKVITLGKFDDSSRIDEQDENQINNARKNIKATVQNKSADSISIMTASGWDFFGEGHPISLSPPQNAEAHNIPFWKFLAKYRQFKKKFDPVIMNGYLLPVISERYRRVRIILLDPDSVNAEQREQDYLHGDGHHPISNPGQYISGMNKCLDRIREAYKSNPNIEVKLISELPKWKMVIVENESWVQPIIPTFRSDHSPLFGFKKTDYSMYHVYFNIFENYWHNSKNIIDLNSTKAFTGKPSSST